MTVYVVHSADDTGRSRVHKVTISEKQAYRLCAHIENSTAGVNVRVTRLRVVIRKNQLRHP